MMRPDAAVDKRRLTCIPSVKEPRTGEGNMHFVHLTMAAVVWLGMNPDFEKTKNLSKNPANQTQTTDYGQEYRDMWRPVGEVADEVLRRKHPTATVYPFPKKP